MNKLAVMMHNILKERRDRPILSVLSYIRDKLEEAKVLNIEPDWGKLSKESKRLWWDNL